MNASQIKEISYRLNLMRNQCTGKSTNACKKIITLRK